MNNELGYVGVGDALVVVNAEGNVWALSYDTLLSFVLAKVVSFVLIISVLHDGEPLISWLCITRSGECAMTHRGDIGRDLVDT